MGAPQILQIMWLPFWCRRLLVNELLDPKFRKCSRKLTTKKPENNVWNMHISWLKYGVVTKIRDIFGLRTGNPRIGGSKLDRSNNLISSPELISRIWGSINLKFSRYRDAFTGATRPGREAQYSKLSRLRLKVIIGMPLIHRTPSWHAL